MVTSFCDWHRLHCSTSLGGTSDTHLNTSGTVFMVELWRNFSPLNSYPEKAQHGTALEVT